MLSPFPSRQVPRTGRRLGVGVTHNTTLPSPVTSTHPAPTAAHSPGAPCHTDQPFNDGMGLLPSLPSRHAPRPGRRFSVIVTHNTFLPSPVGSVRFRNRLSYLDCLPRDDRPSGRRFTPEWDRFLLFPEPEGSAPPTATAPRVSTRRSSHVPLTGRRFSVGFTHNTFLPTPVASVPLPQLRLISRPVAHTMPHIRANSLTSRPARFSLCPEPERSAHPAATAARSPAAPCHTGQRFNDGMGLLPSFPSRHAPRTGRRFGVGTTHNTFLPTSLGSPAATPPPISTVSGAMTDPVADVFPRMGLLSPFPEPEASAHPTATATRIPPGH